MQFLSKQSLEPIDLHLLFIQPYYEAQRNIEIACSSQEIPPKQRTKHLLVGLVLSVPIINTLAILILRTYQSKTSSQALSLLDDQPFAFWPFDRAMPKMLTDGTHLCSIPVDELTQLFLDQLFDEQTGKQGESEFSFSLAHDKLIVKYQDCVLELSEILEQINWSDLDEKWQALDQEELKDYLKQSLIFENLKTGSDLNFQKSNPFIWLYTSYNFYSWLNPLLRNNSLKKGAFPYASSQTNTELFQENADTVNRIAKELFFITLATTASLNGLAKKYSAQCQVIRMAHVPKDILYEIKNENIIVDRGFMSASAPGGGFAGGGPCDEESFRVKFVIQSKNGKYVNEFSSLPENEVLFKPFTKFKVLNYSGDEKSGFKVNLEEI